MCECACVCKVQNCKGTIIVKSEMIIPYVTFIHRQPFQCLTAKISGSATQRDLHAMLCRGAQGHAIALKSTQSSLGSQLSVPEIDFVSQHPHMIRGAQPHKAATATVCLVLNPS